MSYPEKEKRKNDTPPRFQWWLLVAGIVIGVVATLMIVQARLQPAASTAYNPDELALTATSIVEGATARAAGVLEVATFTPETDPMVLTATALAVEHATPEPGS